MFDDPRHMILLSDSSYVPILLFFYKTDFFNLGIHLMAYVQNNNHWKLFGDAIITSCHVAYSSWQSQGLVKLLLVMGNQGKHVIAQHRWSPCISSCPAIQQ